MKLDSLCVKGAKFIKSGNLPLDSFSIRVNDWWSHRLTIFCVLSQHFLNSVMWLTIQLVSPEVGPMAARRDWHTSWHVQNSLYIFDKWIWDTFFILIRASEILRFDIKNVPNYSIYNIYELHFLLLLSIFCHTQYFIYIWFTFWCTTDNYWKAEL